MKVSVGENGNIVLKEVFNGLTLITADGEKMTICMRDSGFEFAYEKTMYTAQKGALKTMKISELERFLDYISIFLVIMSIIIYLIPLISIYVTFVEVVDDLADEEAEEKPTEECNNFYPDSNSTSATKCVFCGNEKWEHLKGTDNH